MSSGNDPNLNKPIIEHRADGRFALVHGESTITLTEAQFYEFYEYLTAFIELRKWQFDNEADIKGLK